MQETSAAMRPWGSFSVLHFDSKTGLIKTLSVSPGQRLSLQRHRHREEHWVVLTGIAEVQLGDQTVRLERGEYVRVPVGEWHRLANPSDTDDVVVAEIQVGQYSSAQVAEEDIERREDDFGRA